jgi:hypothetical protein
VRSNGVGTWAIAFAVFSLVAVVSGRAEVVAPAGAVPESETTAGKRTVTVDTGSFDLSVRSAPSATSQKIGSIANHSRVVITCFARGAEFSGGPHKLNTDLWNRLEGGGYVTDAMLATGSNEPVVPPCVAESAQPVSGRTTGRRVMENPAAGGTDVWAALQKWYFVSGKQFYPAVSGAPTALPGAAKAAGWTVVDAPQANAIVVMPPGQLDAPSRGHAAWVDAVTQRTDGSYLRIIEMDGPGSTPHTWSGRIVKAEKGLSYIPLP